MPSLRAFLDGALQHRGPSTVDELAVAAVKSGITRARNPAVAVRAALGQSETAISLPDGRWTCVAGLLDGTVLTHRVSSDTGGRRDLWPRNDLFPLLPLLGRGLPLDGGGTVALADGHRNRSPVLLGPAGWLPVVPAGALLAVWWRAGSLDVTPVEVDPLEVADRVAALRDAFAYHREMLLFQQWRSPSTSAVLGALMEAPDLLQVPLPPLGEILADLLRGPEPARRECCCALRHGAPYLDDPDFGSPPRYPVDDEVVRPLFP